MNIFDTEDFNEQLLKHMLRSQEVLTLALDLKITGEDFLSSSLAGVQLYKIIGESILSFKEAPIGRNFLEIDVKEGLRVAHLEHNEDNLKEFLDWAYEDEINSAKILEQLPKFVEHRRLRKVIQATAKFDPVDIAKEISKVAVDLQKNAVSSKSVSSSPFAAPVFSEIVEGIPTGFDAIDAKLHGLARQECGLVVGHSGSGKTAITSAMARMIALEGKKVLFISLEEPYQNIVHRWYAAQFKIDYTQLHYGLNSNNGGTKLDLQLLFEEMDPISRETLLNLRIVDARDLTPINIEGLKTILEEQAKEGFIPDVVFIDQLDYVTPARELPKGAQPWMEYERCAFELDHLSQYKIAGEHTFALWVIHQGKGQMKWEFGYDEIAGFRGIVKPFDICLGVGRFSKTEPHINLFSMKVRHTEHVKQSYRAEFQYMSFVQENWSPDLLNKETAEKAQKEHEQLVKVKPNLLTPAERMRQRNVENPNK